METGAKRLEIISEIQEDYSQASRSNTNNNGDMQ
jgi:hypothetical protein